MERGCVSGVSWLTKGVKIDWVGPGLVRQVVSLPVAGAARCPGCDRRRWVILGFSRISFDYVGWSWSFYGF
jgi:hypothetical protein